MRLFVRSQTTVKDVKSIIEILDVVDVPVKLEIMIFLHFILLSHTEPVSSFVY